MKFPILVITYVFVQISSCTQSDVPAEEIIPTNPMVSTSAYSTSKTESGTEKIALSNLFTVTSFELENHDSSQGRYDTTTSSDVHSAASSKITWNPVSIVLSTDVPTISPDHVNTFPSSSQQNTTQYSATNVLNYQTPPSIFENLDHGENELDSGTRVTDISKGLKTTLNSDLPSVYSHKLETVHTENSNENHHVSHGNVDHLLLKRENESVSWDTTKLDTAFEQNVTGIPLSTVSDHTIVEGLISASVANISNQELSAESKEMSTILLRDETVISDSHLFGSTEVTSKNLPRDNLRDLNMENATFTTDSIKFFHDENLKFTTSSNTELDAENREYGTTRAQDLAKTLSFSDKSTEGPELTSQLNLEMSPASTAFDLSEKISESTTTIGLKAINADNLTSKKIPTTLPLDIATNTRISPYTISTFSDEPFPQNSSDHNFLQENHMSTITEAPTSHSSDTTSSKPSDRETSIVSILAGHNKLSTVSDESITTASLETDVSKFFQLNNATVLIETEGSKESAPVSTSISEDIEMEETTLSSAHPIEHFTPTDNVINQTVPGSHEKNQSSMYDASTISSIEQETSVFPTDLSEIVTSTYSPVNTFENPQKLSTTLDPNIMTEHYFALTKEVSTTASNDVEKSNTVRYLPSQKHMDRESSTDSFTEPETVSYHLFPSARTQSPTAVVSDVEETKFSTVASMPSNKEINKETSTNVFTEQSIVPQTASHYVPSLTTFEQSNNNVSHSMLSTFKPIYDFNTEETSTSKLTSYTAIDEITTLLPNSYSSSDAAATTDTSSLPSETRREGKHIPFSTVSTVRATDVSSEYSVLLVTTEKTSVMKTPVNDTEVHYMQIQIEDINLIDRSDMITAIIQFPVDSTYKPNMKGKLARTHQWLDKVLNKEFQNWTKDPFDEAEEQENEIPFGNISIFYVKPTPETNASHITLTFIVYNFWRNRTLPVHFVLGTLNFYSKELKESINSSSVYFYHGLSTENYDLLSAVFDKYGIIIFTICLAVVGITILVCVVVFYRKKTRQSIHYLADSKLQQNLQEAVGIDLTPASIILQDEKEEKGSKICDDEGWLVPIADAPVAEDNNVPNIQDTKL